jgi:DNA modification methylase
MAVIDQVIADDYAIYNGDCIEVMQSMPDAKVHFSIYSPPFGGL